MAWRANVAYDKEERPSFHFDCSETALDECCAGCIKETGWLLNPGVIDTPDCALRIVDDEPGTIVKGDNGWTCAIREAEYQKVHQAELAVYRKRMAGDWS